MHDAGWAHGSVSSVTPTQGIITVGPILVGQEVVHNLGGTVAGAELVSEVLVGVAAAADAVAALGHDATIACTDYLDPQELKFGADSAAEDIDALRTRWGVETIALWSAGSGSDIALSYAAAHPNNLARLILDSPAPVATDAATEAGSEP